MKKITVFMMLATCVGLLQAQTSPDYIFGSDNGAGWNWTTGTQGTASLGNSYKWQFAATATDNHYFKFGETASNADGSGFWVNSSGPDMNYTGGGAKWTAYYRSNMGDGGAIYTAITSGNYYVVKARKQAGNDIDFAVFDNGAAAPVTISSVTRTISSNDLTVTATASAAAGTNEKIWLRYSKDNWTTSTTTEMTFTSGTSYAATLNCTSGDFVSYYVLTTINQTSAPAETDVDFYTVNYNNNSGKNYTVQIGPFSGNYYIPQGTNAKGFSSLANAFANINEVGLSGTVYLYIDDNLSETGANVLLNRSDLSETNNLIIKPSPAKTPTIIFSGCTNATGATKNAGLTLNSTSFVTIDGSNSADGTTKDLTFVMNDGTNGQLVINLYSNCDNIVIKNTVIKFNVPMSSASTTSGIYANGQAGGACDSLIIQNNTIGDETNTPFYAVRITGYGTATPYVYATKIHTLNNTLTAQMRTVYYYVVGSTGNKSTIIGNTIKNPSSTITGYVVYGIILNTYGGTIDIMNNKILTLKTNNASGQGLYGISPMTAQSGAIVNVINNFIGDFYCLNSSSNTTPVYGIYWQTGGIANIYNNTISLSPVNNTTGVVGGLRFGSSVNANVKNNIIII